MAEPQQLPITGGLYLSDSLPISAQQCTNFYVNIVQTQGLSQETLFGTPGTTQLATTSALVADNNRGSHVMADIAYFVNGTALFRLNEDLTLDTLGTITGTGRVSIADNGTQLMVLVPGGDGFIFTDNPDTFTEITDTDFKANGNPEQTVFIDGFFLASTDSKKFIISALNDGLNWTATDFGSAESDPDIIVAPLVFKNQVFVAGSETVEAFQNIGGADFVFQRSNLFLAKGVFAPFSIIKANDTFMFIGGDTNESPAIWSFVGNTVQKVSTTAIDSLLQGFTQAEIADSFAYSYAQKGAYFVCFALPTTTLVIDTITGRWHERKSNIIDAQGNTQTIRSRVNSLITAYGRVLVGDSQDGRIGELDPDVFTEYGNNIIRIVATQPFQNNMKAIFFPKLELTVESGVGTLSVPDPKILLERSTDGGKNYSNGRPRGLGKVGEFNRRAIWYKNGRASRFEVFRFTLSDAVKPVIIQLTADIVSS